MVEHPVTAVEAAARGLAAAVAHRDRAAEIMAAIADTWNQAGEARKAAEARVEHATRELLAAVNPAPVEKLVKRPAETADGLLDLDDNGGH